MDNYETLENARIDYAKICNAESTLDDIIYATRVDVQQYGIAWRANMLETLETARDNIRAAKTEMRQKIKELEEY